MGGRLITLRDSGRKEVEGKCGGGLGGSEVPMENMGLRMGCIGWEVEHPRIGKG